MLLLVSLHVFILNQVETNFRLVGNISISAKRIIYFFSQFKAKGWKYAYFSLSSLRSHKENDWVLGNSEEKRENLFICTYQLLSWQQRALGLEGLTYEELNSLCHLERSWEPVL